jgi:hypothetical protein
MPTNRHYVRRPRRCELNGEQEMELWLGPSHNGTAFSSDEERLDAWLHHRPRLMAWHAQNGRRPYAWWRYESPIPYPGDERRQSALFEAGLLEEKEARDLVTWWKRQF